MASFINILVKAQKFTIALCSLMIAITFGIVVVLRYVFHANLFAYEEWMLVAAYILYFLGAAQGSYEGTHIKADIINELIKSPMTSWRFNLFILAIEVLIGAVLSYWGLLMVAEDLAKYPELPATSVYKIPIVVPLGTIFVGLALMTMYTAMHFVRLLHNRPETNADDSSRSATP